MEVRAELRPSPRPHTIELAISKTGRPVLSVDGKFLHSRYDPDAEGRKIVSEAIAKKPNAKVVVVLGLGFGYHVHTLREMIPAGVPIVVFEALSEIVSFYANHIGRDIENASLWPSPSPQDVVDAVVEKVNPVQINQVLILAHPPSIEVDPAGYQEMLNVIHATFDQLAMSMTTGWGFGFEWLQNSFRNVRRLPELPFLNDLAPVLQGNPPSAMVIGAGPSVDDSWDAIRHAQVLKLAVDTVLEPMERQGLFPHLAFLFDSQVHAASLVEQTRTEEINLVGALNIQPSVFERRWRNIYVASCDDGLLSWLERHGKFSAGRLKQGGSVATCAFDLARQSGCSPIYFTGVDLSFSKHRVYCRGTAYERRATETGGRFNPPEWTQHQMTVDRTQRHVGSVSTQENMYNYYRWMKDEIGRTTSPVILLKGTGLLSEFLPADTENRILEERFPEGFDPTPFERRAAPNPFITREWLDDALGYLRKQMNFLLRPEHYSDPDRLVSALEESNISSVVETVVQPAVAVCRYETERQNHAGSSILHELRERLHEVVQSI